MIYDFLIKIQFFRYCPTLMIYTNKEGKIENIFKESLDHEITKEINTLDYSSSRNIVHLWLQNHYGFCIIHLERSLNKTINYTNDTNKEFKIIAIKINNLKKMKQDLLDLSNTLIKIVN